MSAIVVMKIGVEYPTLAELMPWVVDISVFTGKLLPFETHLGGSMSTSHGDKESNNIFSDSVPGTPRHHNAGRSCSCSSCEASVLEVEVRLRDFSTALPALPVTGAVEDARDLPVTLVPMHAPKQEFTYWSRVPRSFH